MNRIDVAVLDDSSICRIRLREILERVRRHGGEARRLVREHDDQRLLEYVVVECAQELHAEERTEAPLAEQPELAAFARRISSRDEV